MESTGKQLTAKQMKSKFYAIAIPVVVLCFVSQYIYPALPTDQLNFLFPYLAETFGWDPTVLATPLTIGRLLCIPFTFIFGTIIAKKGYKWLFSICIVLLGICEMMLAFVKSFALYCVPAALIPILSAALLMGAFACINSWFDRWRGRVLGIITLSSPLSALITFNILNNGQKAIGFPKTVIFYSLAIIAVGILTIFVIKETPEEVGCYPDGADVPARVMAREDATLVNDIKVIHIAKHYQIWLHAFAFGAMIFAIGCCCSFFNPVFQVQGYTDAQINGLLIGYSVLGMALSALSGVIDDKFGTRTSAIVFASLFVLGMIGFRFGNAETPWLTWVGMIALGGLVGAIPNLNPSMIAYIYGRDAFNSVNRFSNAITYILPSFSVIYMTTFTAIGGQGLNYKLAYNGLIIIAILVLIAILLINKKIDLTADVVKSQEKKAAK